MIRRLVVTLAAVSALVACASTSETPAPRAPLLDPSHPEWSRSAPPVSRMRFETSKGEFVLELIREWAPIGADRFYNLVLAGLL